MDDLVKIGTKVVRDARYAIFQMADVAVPKELFEKIPRLIDGLRRRPAPA
ncbi:hypothetical protein [Reyranella sp.]|nr:hypothetical protein [Reyranella sp.]MDO8972940.1 hypothetical protein [Reyranella sp.]